MLGDGFQHLTVARLGSPRQPRGSPSPPERKPRANANANWNAENLRPLIIKSSASLTRRSAFTKDFLKRDRQPTIGSYACPSFMLRFPSGPGYVGLLRPSIAGINSRYDWHLALRGHGGFDVLP